MQRSATLALALALGTACTAAEEPTEIDVGGSSELELIEGAPLTGKLAPRAGVTLAAVPGRLALIGGVVGVGTDHGVYATSLGADLVEEVRVHPDQEGPKTTGAVRWLTRRTGDSVLVLAESGLYASASGYLLSSPFAESVDPSTITSITAFGADVEEELWVVTSSESFWVASGLITKFALSNSAGPITLAIGTDLGQAVVVAGETAYFVDVRARRAIELASDLGSVMGGDVEEDGSVHLATSKGVLSRTRAGHVSLRTLSAAGQPATPVLSIASSFGSVAALSESGLVMIDESQATLVSDSAPVSGSLAVDANGDAWAVEDGGFYRYETGKPVSFAIDVAPFFTAHCDSCHLPGATSAPDHEFSNFETAKEWSDSIVRRLQATDATTMPPPNAEVLTASDFAVVLRWVKGGLLP
jgi:hypothetical protein